MELLSVSSKGQVVIPERTRKRYGIKQGIKLILIEKEDSLILTKEANLMKHFEESETKEQFGWMILAQKNLQELWDNPKDDSAWRRYLQ